MRTNKNPNKLPKVSIVTTVYNLYKNGRVDYFRQMMETVHNQTYPNMEHILIDNNSDDGTADLIQEYVDKGYVANTYFEKKQGLWHGMNRGIKEATGEFINFMNSDDYFYRNDAVELSINAILKEGADWSYGRSNKVDLNTQEVVFKWYFDDYASIYNARCPNHQTLFVRTCLLREQGGFETNPAYKGTFSDDLSMMRLLFAGHIPAVIPEVLVVFRDGGASSNVGRSGAPKYVHFMKTEFGFYELSEKELDKLYWENHIKELNDSSFADLLSKVNIPAWRKRLVEVYGKDFPLQEIKEVHSFPVNPKISIIVPAYNAEDVIRRGIYSLLNQTYENIEILCINDGSTDHTLDVLKQIQAQDTRLRLFTQQNSGPAKARNVGLQNARGKYIMFMDADDTFHPQMCQLMLQTIQDKNVDVVMCNTQMVGRNFGNYPFPFNEGKFNINLHIRKYTNVWLWNKIFKMDIIRERYLSFPDGHKSDDTVFVENYLRVANTIYFLNRKLINYYRTENSIVESYNSETPNKKDIFDFVYSLEKIISFLKQYINKNTLDDIDDLEYAQYLFKNRIYTAWRNVGKEIEQEFLNRLEQCIQRIGKECVPEDSLLQAIQQRDFDVAANLLDYFSESFTKIKRKKYLFQKEIKPACANNNVPVVFSVTDNYCKYLSVALQSVIDHAASNHNYDIIILTDNVNDTNQLILQNQMPKNFSLRFYNMQGFIEKYKLNTWFYTGRLAPAAYFRLFVPEILQGYKKCIYLDTDIIVQADLYDLYQEDLGDAYVGAVKDVLQWEPEKQQYFTNHLKMDNPNETFFNSGVLLFNLESIKKNDIVSKFLSVAQINCKYYHDQNVLNAVCEGHVKYLSPKWNMITSSWFYKDYHSVPFKADYSAFAANIRAALSGDIKIVHYATWTKPWQNPSLPWAQAWWNVARRSPFYEIILMENLGQGKGKVFSSPAGTVSRAFETETYVREVLKFPLLYLSYLRCRLLKHLTRGEKKQHYQMKRKALHSHIQRARAWWKGR